MENILRKDTRYQWNDECQHGLDTLKEKMVTAPIFVFPDWEKTFHVHVDASMISLGAILAQPGAGDLDHPIAFARRKLSDSEQNYNVTSYFPQFVINHKIGITMLRHEDNVNVLLTEFPNNYLWG
jgi:hypothetical protein